jgi:hypothetical protein
MCSDEQSMQMGEYLSKKGYLSHRPLLSVSWFLNCIVAYCKELLQQLLEGLGETTETSTGLGQDLPRYKAGVQTTDYSIQFHTHY